ncbi:ceramide synthase 1-like [Anneissia japonica]|uniref:ceramide synthase 1-like n=1 Tax=Anneissia japonica TaxID=1529436 RepID=UPI0014256A8A|nr:ceramide synthase 1-like [Anneissia japonica]
MGGEGFLFTPDYIGLFYGLIYELPEYIRTEPVEPEGFIGEFRKYCRYENTDLLIIVLLACVWTCVRHFFTQYIFKPLTYKLQLTTVNAAKFPESAWRCMFYTLSWTYAAYVIFFCGYRVFYEPNIIFKGWTVGSKVSSEIYWLYAVQASFYLHSMFATIFLDVWRSDSLVLCIHHVLTLVLITFSYTVRYHVLGSLVLLCHDCNDIFLELAKCCIYFKPRKNGTKVEIYETLGNTSFAIFFVSWCITRMYWYPFKVLLTIQPSVAKIYYSDHLPFGLEFNLMLWAIMLMDVYWFVFICILLIKILTGNMKEMEDIREDNDGAFAVEKLETNGKSNGNGIANGNGLKKRHVGGNGTTHSNHATS